MQVSIVCMDNGIQSDSIVTTQHSNAWLCEYACIYTIGVQTVKFNSMLAPNNLIRPQKWQVKTIAVIPMPLLLTCTYALIHI